MRKTGGIGNPRCFQNDGYFGADLWWNSAKRESRMVESVPTTLDFGDIPHQFDVGSRFHFEKAEYHPQIFLPRLSSAKL